MKIYRDNGAVGAILDEYEKAIHELLFIISDIDNDELVRIIDTVTKDEDCRSVQSILTHVIRSGYNYVNVIKRSLGDESLRIFEDKFNVVETYSDELSAMFSYTEAFFENHPNIILEEKDQQKKLLVSWGQHYDIEQLMEHAIVHILRHRRQLERFLRVLRK
ncbi:MAG: DinB family protein [Saprospiraceae bacterium]